MNEEMPLDEFYSDEEPENFESQKEDMKMYLNKLNKRIIQGDFNPNGKYLGNLEDIDLLNVLIVLAYSVMSFMYIDEII